MPPFSLSLAGQRLAALKASSGGVLKASSSGGVLKASSSGGALNDGDRRRY
uniref:Uncharacterized protein n=1 Tax=Arundo donax TaxID=35708 RepID=A0A0A9CK95_ARUDO